MSWHGNYFWKFGKSYQLYLILWSFQPQQIWGPVENRRCEWKLYMSDDPQKPSLGHLPLRDIPFNFSPYNFLQMKLFTSAEAISLSALMIII